MTSSYRQKKQRQMFFSRTPTEIEKKPLKKGGEREGGDGRTFDSSLLLSFVFFNFSKKRWVRKKNVRRDGGAEIRDGRRPKETEREREREKGVWREREIRRKT